MSTLEPDPLLFHRDGLRNYLQDRLVAARTTIEDWDPDRLLQTPDHDLVQEITEHYSVECPIPVRAEIQALPTEDGHSHFRDGFGDQVRQRIIVRRYVIPFTGDADVFAWQASTFTHNPPRAKVTAHPSGGGELQISLQALQGQNADANQIRQAVHAELDKIDRHLEWARGDIAAYTRDLATISAGVATRKAEVLRERDLEAAIGFPVRRRADANRYVVPVRRKTIKATTPPRTAQPFTPEPVLGDDDYEAALTVLTSSRNALERTPSMTKTLTEEKIRDLLLVNLNAQFEGAAAGEVFNGSGKTDILIREKDRNIFIAECKIWKGPKTISDALDQLLGYLVWRDTKAAMLLFIRSGKPTEIMEKSLATIEAHSNYKRTLRRGPDGERSDFVVHANGDQARDIRLAFLPFVLPSE
ncbi:MAG: hypothetical protein M3Y44_04905 [Actinomycetota bacterium]|nr:hypothetical protein [Actinomycetota bacterium]